MDVEVEAPDANDALRRAGRYFLDRAANLKTTPPWVNGSSLVVAWPDGGRDTKGSKRNVTGRG